MWREIDLSLSRVNPDDFNLDIEQMYWAPFTGTVLVFGCNPIYQVGRLTTILS